MKKKVLAAMMLAMALVLPGCGSNPDSAREEQAGVSEVTDLVVDSAEAVVDDATVRTETYLAQAEYGDVVDPTWQNPPLAPKSIIDDYLSGHQDYLDTYYSVDEDGWLHAEVFYSASQIVPQMFYPGAVYDDDNWEASELIASYFDQKAPWKACFEGWENPAMLFSADYRTCFNIDAEWLEVNGVRVQPIYDTIVAVEPKAILATYQHGEWDGTTPIFSYDYGTMLEVDPYDGTLDYSYREISYKPEYDVKGLAYTQYLDPPIFMVTGEYEDFQIKTNALAYDADYSSINSFQANVDIYLDLPNGTKDGFEDLLGMFYAGPKVGMYIVLPDRIELYRRGVLIDTWECAVTTLTPNLICYDWGIRTEAFAGETHAWIADDKIVRLLPGGKIETVLDGIVETYGIGEYSLLELALNDGKLTGYNYVYGLVEIAENIASVDYAWDIALMTGTDGKCYAFGSQDYMEMERQADRRVMAGEPLDNDLPARLLGDESWERYLELYDAGLLESFMDDIGSEVPNSTQGGL